MAWHRRSIVGVWYGMVGIRYGTACHCRVMVLLGRGMVWHGMVGVWYGMEGEWYGMA